MKIYWRVVLLLFAIALLMFLYPDSQHAFADGGAPNLAYVAGTSNGISVIDIGQQKVTSSFAVNGDPQMILLSLDGRYLYVTQPTLGRVGVISARTGKTICSANLPGQPTLLALGPQSGALYAAGNGASIVSALDLRPVQCNALSRQTVLCTGWLSVWSVQVTTFTINSGCQEPPHLPS